MQCRGFDPKYLAAPKLKSWARLCSFDPIFPIFHEQFLFDKFLSPDNGTRDFQAPHAQLVQLVHRSQRLAVPVERERHDKQHAVLARREQVLLTASDQELSVAAFFVLRGRSGCTRETEGRHGAREIQHKCDKEEHYEESDVSKL